MLRLAASLAVLLMLVSAPDLSAQDTILRAILTNDAETHEVVPTTSTGDPRPASFGNAMFILSEDMTSMSYTAEIFNIDVTGSQTPDPNDDLGAAHIHARPDLQTANGGVVWGFFGSPFNDNNPDDSVVTPFATGVGGTFSGKWDAPEGQNTTLAEQLPAIFEGRTYMNFHTTQFGAGEIRGTLTVIPEPASLILAGMGGLLTVLLVRRKRVG